MSVLSPLQVLLVDDNAHMRSIVAAILKGAGIERVREVSDGADAMRVLREFHADIAIVDFNMSPLDGVEFTRLVRNASDSPNTYLPVIMMTGHAERSRVEEARNAGVTEFVVKPLTAKSIAYWKDEANSFAVEAGLLEVRVGSSSDNIKLRQTIKISR